jgi:putative ATP-binding cassette transporter
MEHLEERGTKGDLFEINPDFSELILEDISFAFPAQGNDTPFSVGPVDFRIKRGEIVFVSGGNGSGKSTFIKLLTALYKPQQGRLKLDNMAINATHLAGYRKLIAPVFSDFHLFSKLYGMEEEELIQGDDLMRWMEMENISRLKGGEFTRTNLSSGQRKRLALVAALLEKKPILILDEWAADQDPHFRKKFYREILPELKQKGLTIVAVTHDDRYFDAADRRIHFEEGKFTESTGSTATKGGKQ